MSDKAEKKASALEETKTDSAEQKTKLERKYTFWYSLKDPEGANQRN